MTVIAAVKTNDGIAMAADSATTHGGAVEQVLPVDKKKVRRLGGALVAFSGWSIYHNILDDLATRRRKPKLDNTRDIYRFFLAFKRTLKADYDLIRDGVADENAPPFFDFDTRFLIASKGGIFEVSSIGNVTEVTPWYAIGCAEAYAMGALKATYAHTRSASALAKQAVKVACDLHPYCRPPITVEEL